MAAHIMRTMYGGISINDIRAMTWLDLVRWWGHARMTVEGPDWEDGLS